MVRSGMVSDEKQLEILVMDNEMIIQEALANSAVAKDLGEKAVRAIVSYYIGDEKMEPVYDSAWFEGWKYYNDTDDFIEEYYDVEEEMDRACDELDEIPDDENELLYIVYEHLTEVVFNEFEVIDLSECSNCGEGFLIRS